MLHSSPGPAIELFGGDFMPYSFIAGNVVVLGLLAFNKRLSGAVNVALLGLFINFVGLGLEGALDNGEYNLALNDGVKGCPTYEQVRVWIRVSVRVRHLLHLPVALNPVSRPRRHGLPHLYESEADAEPYP